MKKYDVYLGLEAVTYIFTTIFMVFWLMFDIAIGNCISWRFWGFLINLMLSQVFYNLRQHAK